MTDEGKPREVGSHAGLGPLLAEADMEALAAVAHQAGLDGIDLHALARVLDAAQRVAAAAERERWREINAMAERLEQMAPKLADENERLRIDLENTRAEAVLAVSAAVAAERERPRAAVPAPGSPEASAMIDSVLAEYGWPANPKNAARAGYVAAQRLMTPNPQLTGRS